MSKPWGRLRKFLWPSQKSWTLSKYLDEETSVALRFYLRSCTKYLLVLLTKSYGFVFFLLGSCLHYIMRRGIVFLAVFMLIHHVLCKPFTSPSMVVEFYSLKANFVNWNIAGRTKIGILTAKWIWDWSIFSSKFPKQYDSLFDYSCVL